MMPRPRSLVVVLALVVSMASCGGADPGRTNAEVVPTPRKTVVWLTDEGIDGETADRLVALGVDQLVVRRGDVILSGGAPVVRLLPSPPLAGPIPTATALEVRGLGSQLSDEAADSVWTALEADFGTRLPVELILDMPELGDDAAKFLTRLGQRSGLAIIPVLTVSQLETDAGRAVAQAAHRCIVPIYGSQDADLRGLGERNTQPLAVRLATIEDRGIRVRVAMSLRPKTDPDVGGWAEDANALTEDVAAEIKRTSILDRSFLTRRSLSWGGRSFDPDETIAVAWVDAARLGLFLTECHRTVLPEIEGWDFVSLPPVGTNLGLDREEFLRYLGGQGPAPTVDVDLRRSGRNLSVQIANSSVFRSAITAFGNWVQIELLSGALVATSRGSFDRVILGTVEEGEWRSNPPGGPSAVRFVENYLAPGEEITTGRVRLPSSRSRVVVRWQIQLSDGSSVGGVVE